MHKWVIDYVYPIAYLNTMTKVQWGTKSPPPMFEDRDNTTEVNSTQLLAIVLLATTVPVGIILLIIFVLIIIISTRKSSKLYILKYCGIGIIMKNLYIPLDHHQNIAR